MSTQGEILFMQTRIIRLAATRWDTSIQKVSSLFDRTGILKYISDQYDVFHMEGDQAVLDELEEVLEAKGVQIHAEVK